MVARGTGGAEKVGVVLLHPGRAGARRPVEAFFPALDLAPESLGLGDEFIGGEEADAARAHLTP